MSIGERGPVWDRQWMLVDKENKFVTQRQLPQLSQISAQVIEDSRVELVAPNQDFMDFGVEEGSDGETFLVKIWDDQVEAQEVEPEVSEWVSEFVKQPLKLVRMKAKAVRAIDPSYGTGQTSFTDGFPLLIVSQESLELLNSKLGRALSMNRFRPNVVVNVNEPHEEDSWNEIEVNGLTLFGAKLCSRCKVTTVQPLTGQFEEEPLKTLATYRQTEKGIVFGKNFVHRSRGELRVGLPITVRL